MPDIATTASSVNKEAVFSLSSDASKSVQDLIDSLSALDQTALGKKINQHTTQIYSYDGRAAVSLQIPGFASLSADGSSQCMVYDQAHYFTQTVDDYQYDIGWTQRLVIKVDTWDVKASLTVPSAIAASCDVGSSTASVQYAIRGLSGPYKNLTGDAAKFGVDQFAQYRIKMQGLLDDLDNGKTSIEPVVIARVRVQGVPQTSNRDIYRGYAYRLAGVTGILGKWTADDYFHYLTTDGKDHTGKPVPISDQNYLKECIDSAYADYGIVKGGKLSDIMPLADQNRLIDTINGDLDGFALSRHEV